MNQCMNKLTAAVRNHKGEVLLATSKRVNLGMGPSLAEALRDSESDGVFN